jgi:hypothetical protein
LFQEWADVLDGVGDDLPVHAEQLAEDGLCTESALVEHSGQDPVGVGELEVASYSGSAAPRRATPGVAIAFALCCLGFGQRCGQLVEELAGHAGQFRIGEQSPIRVKGADSALGV